MSAALKYLVPARIKRSPTDLLSLLARTVSPPEAGGPSNYIYVDDPFLLPISTSERRSYALSKVSGERAARFVVNKFPFAFFLHKSFPEIPSYDPDYPSPSTAQLADPTVEHLVTLLNHGKAGDAYRVYKALKATRREIGLDIRITLLECLSAIQDDEYYEPSADERWYIRNVHIKPWTERENALQLYEDIKEELAHDSHGRTRALSAMINGYAQSGDHCMSIETYLQLRSEIPCKFTMCNVIRSTSCLQPDKALSLIRQVLHENSSVRPDARIFSAVFYALDQLAAKNKREGQKLLHSAVDCLAEMRQLGITHSLGTLANLAKLLRHVNYTAEFPQLVDWAADLPDFTVHEQDDCCFFVEAMDLCFKLGRYDIARKLHLLANRRERGISPLFINHGQMSRFHERLLRLAVEMCEDSDHVESLWISLVPSAFTPSDDLFLRFMDFLKNFRLLSSAKNWPSRLFEEICSLRLYRRGPSLLSKLFYLLRGEEPEAAGKVASACLALLTEDEELRNSVEDDPLLSDLLYILAASRQLEPAISILEKWTNTMFDKPSLDALLALYLECGSGQHTLARTHKVLEACAKLGIHEFNEAFELISGHMILSRKEKGDLMCLAPQERDDHE